MFGKKSKLERVKADAKADYLKCGALDPEDRMHRVFAARIAQRARLNLDKIFVQGAARPARRPPGTFLRPKGTKNKARQKNKK